MAIMPTMDAPPPDQLIRFTLWSSIYDIDRPTDVAETWPQLVARFSQHQRLPRKDVAQGFGPYRLLPPPTTCYKHPDASPRDWSHRCDRCVEEITLLVFDADQGDQGAVDGCARRLTEAGIAHLWYSSYSHGLRGKIAYRLVIPMDQPVAPDPWPQFRTSVLYRYGIPADPRQCSGRSHYYFVPSCPAHATPVVRIGEGNPVRVVDHISAAKPQTPSRKRIAVVDDYAEPDDPPAETPDWGALRERLKQQQKKLARDGAGKYKAELLARLLAGESLAGHGQRNAALLAVTGMLAYLLPGHARSTYVQLMQPSLDVMKLDEGSDTAKRMLLGAMRCKYLDDKRDAEIKNMWANRMDRVQQRIDNGTIGT